MHQYASRSDRGATPHHLNSCHPTSLHTDPPHPTSSHPVPTVPPQPQRPPHYVTSPHPSSPHPDPPILNQPSPTQPNPTQPSPVPPYSTSLLSDPTQHVDSYPTECKDLLQLPQAFKRLTLTASLPYPMHTTFARILTRIFTSCSFENACIYPRILTFTLIALPCPYPYDHPRAQSCFSDLISCP